MKVEVRIEYFRWVHGCNPKGQGSWFFTNKAGTWNCNVWGNYAEAKKKAKNEAKQNNISVIYVEA